MRRCAEGNHEGTRCHVSSQNSRLSRRQTRRGTHHWAMENLAPGRCVCVAEQPRGRAFVHGLGEQRPDVCRPGSPRSPLATRTLLLDSDHAVVPLSPLVLNNALLSPGRTPRKLQGSAVRIPVNHAPAVQPHDAPPATGSVMALAQVKTPKRCGNSPLRSSPLPRVVWVDSCGPPSLS